MRNTGLPQLLEIVKHLARGLRAMHAWRFRARHRRQFRRAAASMRYR